MKKFLMLMAFCSLIGCYKAAKKQEKNSGGLEETITVSLDESGIDKKDWKYYKEKVNVGFILEFKYPLNLFADTIENGRCIGKRVKSNDPDDPINNSMDCSIWMEDALSNPIEYYLSYDRKAIKAEFVELEDSVIVAGKHALRLRFFDKKSKKHLVDNLYLKKFGTLFLISNERLSETDFDYFLKSIRIEKE